MRVEQRGKRNWWIVGNEYDATCPEMGPYETRAEAVDDMRGVLRFYRSQRIKPAVRKDASLAASVNRQMTLF